MGKFIDEKGKIFGLINIIDLVVILVFLAIAGRFSLRALPSSPFINEGEGIVVDQKDITLTIMVSKVRDATVNVVHPGDVVREARTNDLVGTVIDVTDVPHVTEFLTPDGEVKVVDSILFRDMYVVVRGKGFANPNTILIGKNEYRIGSIVNIKTGLYSITGTVMAIEISD